MMSHENFPYQNVNTIEDMVDMRLMERILGTFSKATGLRVYIIDQEGEMIVKPIDAAGMSSFCQQVRQVGRPRCRRCYARAGKEAAKYGEPYIFRCHAGLVLWAAPLMVEGEHVATIICGQVLMWEPEDFFWEEIEEYTRPLELDSRGLMERARELSVISADRVQAVAEMLFETTNHILRTGMASLYQLQEIAAHQALINEEMQDRKLEQSIRQLNASSSLMNFLKKEQELSVKVRQGDRHAAQQALDSVLADLLEKFPGNTDEVKARIIELLVILSRATIEGGANPQELLTLNCRYIEEINRIQSLGEVCLWIKKALGVFLDNMDDARCIKNLQVVNSAVDYIRAHYQRRLTLDEIAQQVYVSASYLSRLFKKEIGCTVIELLTKVRVEEAKKVFHDPKYTVRQVAAEIGFEDANYFSKVFRRIEGITPSKYKQKAI
ncbi:MAG: PocR ligand-binding domain-containing protein [Thermacetogeniaceae bacterium]